MKLRSAFLILLCAVLVLSVGCGKKENTNSDESTTAASVFNEDKTDNNATETTLKAEEKTTAKASPQQPQNNQAQSTEPLTVEKTELYNNSDKQIIYYPTDITSSNKTYPLIAWANGTMCTPELYDGLLRQIAAGGYIVVANTEMMANDGTKQCASVDFLVSENSNKSSMFYQKIDTQNIGVAGHSQGGRSAVNAATADSQIKCVLSLAGSSYTNEAEKLSTPTFFIAGTNDNVVNASMWVVSAYNTCKGAAVYASVNDAIHTTCCTNPEKYSSYAVSWFNAWLKSDSQAKDVFKNGGALSQDSAWTDFACKGI